jgi:hypothetical protein
VRNLNLNVIKLHLVTRVGVCRSDCSWWKCTASCVEPVSCFAISDSSCGKLEEFSKPNVDFRNKYELTLFPIGVVCVGEMLELITRRVAFGFSLYVNSAFISSTVSILREAASLPTVPSKTSRFFSWSCSTRSSTVPSAMNLTARMGRCCPRRCVRSMA